MNEPTSRSDELTGEEMRRILERPEVQEQLREALAEMAGRRRSTVSDITTEEQLREFLREHG